MKGFSPPQLGEIMDLLVGQSGQAETAIVGVGGFLGAGEKDVAVSFNAIKPTKKNDKTYLTLDTTKDALHWALSTTDKARRGFPTTIRAARSDQVANAHNCHGMGQPIKPREENSWSQESPSTITLCNDRMRFV
jgi:PRC-barrel domain